MRDTETREIRGKKKQKKTKKEHQCCPPLDSRWNAIRSQQNPVQSQSNSHGIVIEAENETLETQKRMGELVYCNSARDNSEEHK